MGQGRHLHATRKAVVEPRTLREREWSARSSARTMGAMSIFSNRRFVGETWVQLQLTNSKLLISMVGAIGIDPTTSPV